jgi:cytochrome c
MEHVAAQGVHQVIDKQAASVLKSRGSRTWSALLVAGVAAAALAQAAPARADAELARAKNCMACHAVDKKLIGPSYKDVALKYANDKNAVPSLAKKVREGGVGVWGQIPMPANPQVSAEEAVKLVNWVLGQK